MKSTLFQILLFLPCLSLQAQATDSLRLQRVIPATATFVTSDNLANTYLISPENAIVKYDTLGRKVAVYSNNRLGSAAFLDATNPLKILLWYPDFQTVVWLDRTLTEMGRLNFAKMGLYSVKCVSMSFDGNIWVFDDAVSKAIKLDLDGSVLLESPPLNIYFPHRFSAIRIRDSGRYVCLSDPDSGLCTLDQYGSLVNTYSTFRIQDFETNGEWLFYLNSESLCLQHLENLTLLYVPLPTDGKGWLGKNCLYWQQGKTLEQYVWK